MAPIEVLFGTLVLTLALIGLVRGFLRELGVTTVMMVTLLVLRILDPLLERGLARLAGSGADAVPASGALAGQTWFFVLVILAAAFLAYASDTLAFSGQRVGGALGLSLGLVTGAINGYLIAGSLWYYMHRWDYSISLLHLSSEGLSKTAVSLVDYLPLSFLGQPVFLGQSLLLYLVLLLAIARVIR